MENNKPMWGLIIVAGIFTATLIFFLFTGPEPDWNNVEAQKVFFEVRRLFFAAGVLGVLSFLLVLGIAVCIWGPPATGGNEAPGKFVFDSLIKSITPIITLVIGFYFGQQTGMKLPAEQQASSNTKQIVSAGQSTGNQPAPQPEKSDGQQSGTKLPADQQASSHTKQTASTGQPAGNPAAPQPEKSEPSKP